MTKKLAMTFSSLFLFTLLLMSLHKYGQSFFVFNCKGSHQWRYQESEFNKVYTSDQMFENQSLQFSKDNFRSNGVRRKSKKANLDNSNRRQYFNKISSLSVGYILLANKKKSNAIDSRSLEKNYITVLGAKGRTGRLIVEELLKSETSEIDKSKLRFVVRPNTKEKIKLEENYVFGDVTEFEELKKTIAGSKVVIFAASASAKGGSAAENVDYKGVVNTAKVCLELGVPKLIVISSGAVTRPDSFGYKVTNFFTRNNIMGWKAKGEDELRALYSDATSVDEKGIRSHYTIVRPGGLIDKSTNSISNIELNQGDTIIGEISRLDLAKAVVALVSSRNSDLSSNDVTFELYEKSSKAPLEKRFPKISGYEIGNKNTWEDLYKYLTKDKDLNLIPNTK